MSAGVVERAVDWFVVCGAGAVPLAIVAWFVDRRLGARRPGLAAAAWWCVLARFVLPPAIASPFGHGVERVTAAATTGGAANGHAAQALTEQAVAALDPWPWTVVGAWLVGALVATAVLALRLHREARAWSRVAGRAPAPTTRRVLARATRAMGLARSPRVVVTDEVGPATVGLVRPWIALPAAYEADPAALESALLHELAHARRRDAWRRLVAQACVAVFWFHPAAWFASRRLAALAEFDCDRRAAAAGDAAAYRRTLLDAVARRAGLVPEHGLASGFGHPRSVALARLRALEGAAVDRVTRVEAPVAALAFVAVACVLPRTVEPATSPSPMRFVEALPDAPIEELPGCLNKRYAVMAHLAAQRSAATAPSASTASNE